MRLQCSLNIHKSDSKLKEVIEYVNSLLSEEDIPMSEIKQESNNKYQEYINMLQQVHNLVLTGAPGTGKTYNTAAIALSVLGVNFKITKCVSPPVNSALQVVPSAVGVLAYSIPKWKLLLLPLTPFFTHTRPRAVVEVKFPSNEIKSAPPLELTLVKLINAVK